VTDSNPFRSEIEQILTDHPRTRFAKVLLGMNRGLIDADMAQEAHADGESIRADSIAAVRRIVLLSLNDELVTAPSEAEEQANVYRELLNYSRSPELNQHITTRLTGRHFGTRRIHLRHRSNSDWRRGCRCCCRTGSPDPRPRWSTEAPDRRRRA
jgi:hypothetical protein